ncbi:hypothetical protein QYM36_017061 [Artemia franciscana]|uniref:CREG-like beta-barrel domain-containing protein n=1 Tax=Artemia franciscana TaxID=6661 RepID=A0AA88H9K2_ARTSF|nr:hypothetical protein QYM36_017061 [Artemia franciscana]
MRKIIFFLTIFLCSTNVSSNLDLRKYFKVDPPPHEDVAKMARYIVHVSDWAGMATISTRQGILGSPFANIFSVSDGTKKKSTGVPYMYLTDLEMSVKDLKVDNRASITMSLAQTSFCKRHKYDPESPLCAHVVLTGNVEKVAVKNN